MTWEEDRQKGDLTLREAVESRGERLDWDSDQLSSCPSSTRESPCAFGTFCFLSLSVFTLVISTGLRFFTTWEWYKIVQSKIFLSAWVSIPRGLNLSSSQGPSQGIGRDFGKVMYMLLYLKWITNKDLLYSPWNSAQCHMLAWMGGELGGGWIHIYVWLSPFVVHLKLQHC